MKHTVLYFALIALSLTLGGCLAEELIEVTPEDPEEVPIVGEFVNANLCLDVGDVYVSSTKSEEPSDDPVSDTDAERKVEGIWVFQFDANSLEIVNGSPKYLAITDQETLMDIPTANTLVDNNGSPCYVYVVANVGSASWVSVSTGFTLNDLLEATIPNPDPIYVDTEGNPASSIPMSGQTESSVVVKDNARIIVPVYRMFAKLMVAVGVDVGAQDIVANPTALDIGQVPNTCTVGTLFTDDTTVPTYPDGTKFLPWTFSISSDYNPEDYFIIYVPENIQGETTNETVGEKSTGAPSNALMVTTHLDLKDETGATIKADPQYTVYPGGNVTNNFNIRRNCVYRVTVTIQPSDIVSPSANCLVASVGETFAFYPYVRDEVGHTTDGYQGTDGFSQEYYDFDTHLAYDDSNGGNSLRIYSVKIIWQTPGCIGNLEENPNLVRLSGTGRETKIYVTTKTAGNALIAAYAEDGETILWSWHIWVTNNAPDKVTNAIIYYHYDWDANGIDRDSDVSGYPVMRCNLGALATEPGTDYTQTYGMLYQWGRKDPFPPMKTSGGSNNKFYGVYKYCDYTTTGNVERADEVGTVVSINVNDNTDTHINLGSNTGLRGNTSPDYDVFNTYYTMSISPFTQAGGIDYSIKHPTQFIAPVETSFGDSDGTTETIYYNLLASYNNQGDWLPGGDDDLWGGNGEGTISFAPYSLTNGGFEATIEDNYGEEKTIFDPCPYGWRVSPGDLWLGFTLTGTNWNSSNDGGVSTLSTYVNCVETSTSLVASHMGYTMYMQGWHNNLGVGDETSFFPTQGSRLANGQPFHGGICGNYHNATADNVVNVLTDSDGKVVNSGGTATTGGVIRRTDILHFHCQDGDGGMCQVNPFEKELIYYNRAVAGPVRCVRDTKR